MDSIRTAKGLLHEEDFMVKLYLKDAYLSVPLSPPHRRLWPSAAESSFGGSKPYHLGRSMPPMYLPSGQNH